MLKPEAARQQLAKLKSNRHAEVRLARIRKLPGPLAATGFGLFGRQADGDFPKEWQERRNLQRAAALRIAVDSRSRARIFAALFPSFHGGVEAGWQLFTRLPYTTGYNRRSFRAPGRPEMYLNRREVFLQSVLDSVDQLPDDILTPEWLAAWAVHLGWRVDPLGYLFAGMIDAGGPLAETLLTILKDSAANRHEIGGPGGHSMRGLLCCSRPDAWQFAESLLLAAQRQEGLRQTILEAVDEAHPEAFRRMVGVLLDQNLIRFASVARAAGVWLGEVQAVENPKKLTADLQTVRALLADSAARQKVIAKGDAAAAYRGLWAIAFEDAEEALKVAAPLFKAKDPARRFAAAKLAMETGLPEAAPLVLPLLHDADLRLVSLAVQYAASLSASPADEDGSAVQPADLFDQLEKLIPNLPEKEKQLKAPVEGWYVPNLGQNHAANLLLGCLGKRPAERLLPYFPMMDDYARIQALARLCQPRTLTTQVRRTLLTVAGEPNRNVREAALKYLKKSKLAEDEVQTLEGYLTRKTADFRRSIFELLLHRSDKLVLGTIDRLLAAGDANCRAAGVELSRRLVDDDRSADSVRARLRDYREAKGKRLAAAEALAIEIVLNPAARPPTLEDGLGTFNPAERTPVVAPRKRPAKFATSAAVAFLRELDAFIHENRDRTFLDTRNERVPQERVLGSISYRWDFPQPDEKRSITADRQCLPLLELWEDWWTSRSPKTRDVDGLELVRASMIGIEEVREGEEGIEDPHESAEDADSQKGDAAVVKAMQQIRPFPPVKVRYENLIGSLMVWFIKLYPPPGMTDFVLDAAETSLSLVPPSLLDRTPRTDQDETENADGTEQDVEEWREATGYEYSFEAWLRQANHYRRRPGWTTEHDVRLFRLQRWLDEPVSGARRMRPDLDVLLKAYAAGAATRADFCDHLIGPRAKQMYRYESFSTLQQLTRSSSSKSYPLVDQRPELRAAVDEVVERIIATEIVRGETPTAASKPATAIGRIFGLDTLFRLIAALGKSGYSRPAYGQSENKPAVLTTLIQHSVPLPEDTPEAFAAAAAACIAAGKFDLERIAELGLVNPRWVRHVAATLRWPGYEEAVYWFIAHTSNTWQGSLAGEDEEMAPEAEKTDNPWQTIVKARTNLSAEQRADGLIDVAWFHQVYAAVGNAKRWDAIEMAAKFLGYGQGHKKAARLADVLLGRMKKKELVTGIRAKYLKESVRLLGLLPLPADPVKKDAELAERYKVLKEYERYARGLSAMSKEPALQSARLGLENLAVTAGFPDPVRLEWAVTARRVADLANGPVAIGVKNVSVVLTLSPLAEPEVTQTRDGKPLKTLPPEVRKNEKIAELIERKKTLARTAANTKRSLEQAMCAGDCFRGVELKALTGHALVKPVLDRLVLKTAAGMGYPAQGGTALQDWNGKTTPLKAEDEWTIAHPLDFAAAGDWHEWQADCFRAERLQPFKQVFREVYVLSPAEKEDGDRSRRYSGQQVNESQAKALFATRGWSTRDDISKLYRAANLVVHVAFDHGYTTPADAAAPAVNAAFFHRRGDWQLVPLADVPKIIFSEVMRDLDLVVSVAHVGGVDPEASQSTIAMRTDLLRETCELLKLDNVKFDSRHALIQGEYGRYAIHLGSGVVHKQPGGALCVVAVNAQHRGRLFLPFADDDPRTAEVISKTLLLARDREIQDPTILQQIVGK